MAVSLKRALVIVLMALALLAGLFGWSVKMMTVPLSPQHHAMRSHSVVLAYVPFPTCPPPPYSC